MRGRDIVAVGTSAGGVEALTTLVAGLPAGLPAAVFVVLHLSPRHPSFLSQVVGRGARLPVVTVARSTRFRPGTVYLASPDHHLIVDRTRVHARHGPRENWSRPSVDVLFRSVAEAHGPRAVGVVLTGFLDDGSAGLAAVKREGGVTVVQDPDDALFPDMPKNAIESAPVDHCVPLREIPALLARLVRGPAARRPRPTPSQEVAIENEIAKGDMNGRAIGKIGTPSTLVCPECSGPLWELRDGDLLRFRCQVGHAFNADTMLAAQDDFVERSLWVALGAIQARATLWKKLADRMNAPHLRRLARHYRDKEADARRDIARLRGLLVRDGHPARARRR